MCRLKKSQRLLTQKDYKEVFEQANKITTSVFLVFYKKNDQGFARLGLALSKKAIPTAVQRNRIKRQIRESFRLASLPPVDMVFVAKQGIMKKTNENLRKHLVDIWQRLQNL